MLARWGALGVAVALWTHPECPNTQTCPARESTTEWKAPQATDRADSGTATRTGTLTAFGRFFAATCGRSATPRHYRWSHGYCRSASSFIWTAHKNTSANRLCQWCATVIAAGENLFSRGSPSRRTSRAQLVVHVIVDPEDPSSAGASGIAIPSWPNTFAPHANTHPSAPTMSECCCPQATSTA